MTGSVQPLAEVLPGLGKVVALLALLVSVPQAWAQDKPILAVIEVQDNAGVLSSAETLSATNYLRGLLVRSGHFSVVDKSRQEEKKRAVQTSLRMESGKPCYDSRCRIALGKSLSADSLLSCSIDKLGGDCTLTCEIVPLELQVASVAGVVEFSCSGAGFTSAIRAAVSQLTKGGVRTPQAGNEVESSRSPIGQLPTGNSTPPGYGLLTVTTEPSGAEIWVGDSPSGLTPKRQLRLPAGTVSVRLNHAGFRPTELVAQIVSGATAELHEKLVPLMASPGDSAVEKTSVPVAPLEVAQPAALAPAPARPPEARKVSVDFTSNKGGRLFVDDVFLLELPASTVMSEGTYKVRAEHPLCVPVKKSVNVRGRTQAHFDFEYSSQARMTKTEWFYFHPLAGSYGWGFGLGFVTLRWEYVFWEIGRFAGPGLWSFGDDGLAILGGTMVGAQFSLDQSGVNELRVGLGFSAGMMEGPRRSIQLSMPDGTLATESDGTPITYEGRDTSVGPILDLQLSYVVHVARHLALEAGGLLQIALIGTGQTSEAPSPIISGFLGFRL